MRIPGFTAEASLKPAGQAYRQSTAVRGLAVAPAMPDRMMLDAYGNGSGRETRDYPSVIISEYCQLYRKCCLYGHMGCCMIYARDCSTYTY